MTTFSKSQLITGYDANPIYRPTAGQGGPGRNVEQTATILPGATDATTVVYRMVRVPTFAVISKIAVVLELNGGTATTFTGNIGLYWSDNGAVDGTSLINSGSATAVSDSFFTYHVALAAVNTQFTDETFQNTTGNSATDGFYTPSASYQPLWMALTAGGYQGTDANLNAPKGPWDNNFAGAGAVSSTSNAFYQITSDPGGFLDICFRPTTTNSLSASTMLFSLRASFTLPG